MNAPIRKAKAIAMYGQGETITAIAEATGASRATIYRDLNGRQAELAEQAAKPVHEVRAAVIAELESDIELLRNHWRRKIAEMPPAAAAVRHDSLQGRYIAMHGIDAAIDDKSAVKEALREEGEWLDAQAKEDGQAEQPRLDEVDVQ